MPQTMSSQRGFGLSVATIPQSASSSSEVISPGFFTPAAASALIRGIDFTSGIFASVSQRSTPGMSITYGVLLCCVLAIWPATCSLLWDENDACSQLYMQWNSHKTFNHSCPAAWLQAGCDLCRVFDEQLLKVSFATSSGVIIFLLLSLARERKSERQWVKDSQHYSCVVILFG